MEDGRYYCFGVTNAISSQLSRESPPVVDTPGQHRWLIPLQKLEKLAVAYFGQD